MVEGGGKVGIGTYNDGSAQLWVNGSDFNGRGVKISDSWSLSALDLQATSITSHFNGTVFPLFIQEEGDLYLSSESGQVGIGINLVPEGYKLGVHGKVIAEEIRVELESNWPDYVFSDSYVLTPLEELEKVIQNQHHLPGIPSANSIEQNGQHLGAIQIKLLEKIEELTLHIIDLNKRIKLLESNQKQ